MTVNGFVDHLGILMTDCDHKFAICVQLEVQLFGFFFLVAYAG